jgi:hypothetical protein
MVGGVVPNLFLGSKIAVFQQQNMVTFSGENWGFLPGQSLRSRNIHPWPYSGLQTATGTDSHRVGFAESCLTLIGQPFYKARGILKIVASVAGASAAATLAPWEGCNP